MHNGGLCPPFGFGSSGQYKQFSSQLYAGFKKAGYDDTDFLLQGSAVTSRSAETGAAFDVGRVSDIDIAVINPSLLSKLEQAGFRVNADGNAVGPLNAEQLDLLGLNQLQANLSKTMGRPVNFMVYGSREAAKVKTSFYLPNPKP